MCSLLLSYTASRPSEQSGLGNIQIFLTLVVIPRGIFISVSIWIYLGIHTPPHKVHSNLTTFSFIILL